MPRSKRAPRAQPSTGRYSYTGLDRAIHEKARLGIMTSLASHSAGLSFNDLKDLCGLTDGNLARHLDVLREAGLIVIEKEQGSARRQTVCQLTAQGREQFLVYLAELERVVADAALGVRTPAASARRKQGWSPA